MTYNMINANLDSHVAMTSYVLKYYVDARVFFER